MDWEPTTARNFVDKVIQIETEGFETQEELVDFIQYMIDTGYAWTFQGFYGRLAVRFIDYGLCHYPSEN